MNFYYSDYTALANLEFYLAVSDYVRLLKDFSMVSVCVEFLC